MNIEEGEDGTPADLKVVCILDHQVEENQEPSSTEDQLNSLMRCENQDSINEVEGVTCAMPTCDNQTEEVPNDITEQIHHSSNELCHSDGNQTKNECHDGDCVDKLDVTQLTMLSENRELQ